MREQNTMAMSISQLAAQQTESANQVKQLQPEIGKRILEIVEKRVDTLVGYHLAPFWNKVPQLIVKCLEESQQLKQILRVVAMLKEETNNVVKQVTGFNQSIPMRYISMEDFKNDRKEMQVWVRNAMRKFGELQGGYEYCMNKLQEALVTVDKDNNEVQEGPREADA